MLQAVVDATAHRRLEPSDVRHESRCPHPGALAPRAMWNGVRVGASLYAQARVSAFEPPAGHGPMAVSPAVSPAVAQASARRHHRRGWHGMAGVYPDAFRFAKGECDVVPRASAAAMHACNPCRRKRRPETSSPGRRPRPLRCTSSQEVSAVRAPPVWPGHRGALELRGSFVLSTDQELDALRVGRLNARALYAALRAVSPADAAELPAEGAAARA